MTIMADAMAFFLFSSASSVEVGTLPCLSQFSADDHFGRCHGFLIQQRILCGSVGILPCLSNLLQMTIMADAMAFLIQQHVVLCGSVGILPCISADLTGNLLVVAFPGQVAFRPCVTLLVMAL
jgi:hypothetical protein